MKKLLLVIAALTAVNCLAPAQTAILYQEDFGTINGGTSLASVGWSQILVPSGYSGIYAQGGAHDGNTSQPLPANTMYFGGSAGSGIFFTTSGAGSGPNGDSTFPNIDPTLYTNLNISVEAQWSFQGANLKCWFAVFVGGSWYIDTNSLITAVPAGSGNNTFYQSSITYNPAAANWNLLTNTTVVGIGPRAAVDLSGTIDGVGIVTVLSGSGSWDYNNFLVTSISNAPVQAPVLTAAPFSQTAYAGAGVSFSVAANGTPLNYFWQSNGFTLANGGRISGATNATLNIANVNSGDSGAVYSVIVSNSAGEFDTSTNSTATLTVNAVPPDYLYAETFPFVGPLSVNYPLSVVGWSSSIPESPGRLFSNGGGDGAIFNFENSAVTTAFYVTTSSDNGATGLPFPSINPAAYPDVSFSINVAPTFSPANITAYFAVQMTGGNWYVSSTPIPVNTSAATGTYTTYGQTFSPLAANWNNLTLTSTGASIGSGASADLTGNIVGAGVVSVFTGAGNFNLDNFLVVTDFFAPVPPTITASPLSQTVYAGAGVSFAGRATGTQPLSYFWQTNGITLTNSATLIGANSNVLTLLNVNSNSAGQYTLIASNSAGTDSSANYVTTILTVNDLPTNLLYSESFPYLGPSGNFPVTSVGWAAAIPDAPTRLYQNAAGDGAIYNSESSAGTTAFYATTASDTGVSGLPFPSINIAGASDLTFAVDVDPTFQATNVTASLAVQINGANWYVSATALPVDTSSTGFTTVTQAFSPTAANWKNLTLTGTGATIGSAASADLSGNITGAGLVSVFSGAGNFNFDNFQITGTVILNPGSISISNEAGPTFTLNWTANPNVHLQSATNLTAPISWSDVAGTAGQGFATITATNAQMFFRLEGQ